ncbi:hypothetical protein D3C72_129800 [compost metagenome]
MHACKMLHSKLLQSGYMEYGETRPTLSTKQAQWKRQWIGVFVSAGIERAEAEIAFKVYYGIQGINIFIDPIDEANGLTGMSKVIVV